MSIYPCIECDDEVRPRDSLTTTRETSYVWSNIQQEDDLLTSKIYLFRVEFSTACRVLINDKESIDI